MAHSSARFDKLHHIPPDLPVSVKSLALLPFAECHIVLPAALRATFLFHFAVHCQKVSPTPKQELQLLACRPASSTSTKATAMPTAALTFCQGEHPVCPTHLPFLQAYEQRERQRAADRRRGAEILDEQLAERERERIKQEELRQLVSYLHCVLTPAGMAAA